VSTLIKRLPPVERWVVMSRGDGVMIAVSTTRAKAMREAAQFRRPGHEVVVKRVIRKVDFEPMTVTYELPPEEAKPETQQAIQAPTIDVPKKEDD